MGGGVLQLSLYGSQDIVLTGSPEVTFFRLLYRRPSQFSMEAIAQAYQGTADFGKRCTLPIARSGDLVNTVWLEVTLPDLSDYSIGPAQTATTTIPGILSARFTSTTTAVVKIIEPTDGLSDKYIITASEGGNDTEFVGASGATSVTLTGLSTANTYTVTARRRKVDLSEGAESSALAVSTVRWCNGVGHALIQSVELEIGGSRIARHISEYMDIMAELTLPEEKRAGFNTMIGKYDSFDLYTNSFSEARTLYIPLQFPFCKSPGLSIPLVSLQFHDTKLNFQFRPYEELIKSDIPISSLTNSRGVTPSVDIKTFATFIFLDTEERRRFNSAPMEQLIEEVQFLGDTPIIVDTEEPSLTRKINLNFSHPVKEIMWVYNSAASYNSGISASQYPTLGNDYFNCDLPSPHQTKDPVSTAKIQLQGHDRFSERPGSYFRLCQPYAHHTRIPTKKIYSYSFGLSPEEFSPTGTCNFSRLDTAHLVLGLNSAMTDGSSNGRIRVFATSFNVFRVASGMGGLSFASG